MEMEHFRAAKEDGQGLKKNGKNSKKNPKKIVQKKMTQLCDNYHQLSPFNIYLRKKAWESVKNEMIGHAYVDKYGDGVENGQGVKGRLQVVLPTENVPANDDKQDAGKNAGHDGRNKPGGDDFAQLQPLNAQAALIDEGEAHHGPHNAVSAYKKPIRKDKSSHWFTVLSLRCSVTFWTHPETIPVGQFFRRWILRSRSFRLIDWLIDDKLTLTWLVYWIRTARSVFSKKTQNFFP